MPIIELIIRIIMWIYQILHILAKKNVINIKKPDKRESGSSTKGAVQILEVSSLF